MDKRYTLQQRIKIIKIHYKYGGNLAETVRKTRKFLGRREAPCRTTIQKLVDKFELLGQLTDVKNKTRARRSRKAENIAAVAESVQENPMKSIPCRAQELGLSQTTIWRILRQDLGLHEELKGSNIRDEQPPEIKRLKNDKIALKERHLTKNRIAEST